MQGSKVRLRVGSPAEILMLATEWISVFQELGFRVQGGFRGPCAKPQVAVSLSAMRGRPLRRDTTLQSSKPQSPIKPKKPE